MTETMHIMQVWPLAPTRAGKPRWLIVATRPNDHAEFKATTTSPWMASLCERVSQTPRLLVTVEWNGAAFGKYLMSIELAPTEATA